jgi:hypothetical protein
MTKMSKADQEQVMKLHPTARRYEKNAYRAKQYNENTGNPMFVPGELTRMKRESKAAQAQIDAIQAKYR